MKVKLLKRLRKRFFWFVGDGDICWSYYDNYENKVIRVPAFGGRHNDNLLCTLLEKLGLDELYYLSNEDRKLRRQRLRDEKLLKEKFSKHFKKR